MNKSIVLLSGGMDSALTAAIAKSESDSISALHLNYRNRTEKRELKAFNDVADALDISERLVVDIEFLRTIGGSSLTDKSIDVTKADLWKFPFNCGKLGGSNRRECHLYRSRRRGFVRLPRLPPFVFRCFRKRDRYWNKTGYAYQNRYACDSFTQKRDRARVGAFGRANRKNMVMLSIRRRCLWRVR